MQPNQDFLTKRDRSTLSALARKNPMDIGKLAGFHGGLVIFAGVVTGLGFLVRGDWGAAGWGMAMVGAGWIEVERGRYMRIIGHLLRAGQAKVAGEVVPTDGAAPDTGGEHAGD